MILHHVAHDARLIVIASPVFDCYGFGDCNLHVVNIVTVPYRFKDCVCKTKYQQVLHHVLTKIMIDTINLTLIEHLPNKIVQFRGRREIIAKWFLYDNSAPSC